MKARGKIVNLDLDFITHRPKLTLQLSSQYLTDYDSIKDLEDLDITIEKHREKKTKDANSYLWKLCQEIANKLDSTKEEIYREAIRDKGPFEIVPIKDEAVEHFIWAWSKQGLGWCAEVLGKSKLEDYTNVIAYYGSSTFDKKQMRYVVGYVDQEAKKMGIKTLSDLEFERMMKAYGVK
jgi:hypothetical protein